ncbi:unnamed protein product, partial [Iphiclides podalirius]
MNRWRVVVPAVRVGLASPAAHLVVPVGPAVRAVVVPVGLAVRVAHRAAPVVGPADRAAALAVVALVVRAVDPVAHDPAARAVVRAVGLAAGRAAALVGPVALVAAPVDRVDPVELPYPLL